MKDDVVLRAHERDDELIVSYHQDVEPALKAAHEMRRIDAEYRTAYGKRKEFRKVMTVPNVIMLEICRKLGIPFGQVFDTEHQARIMRELKGPDYKAFRTVVDKRL